MVLALQRRIDRLVRRRRRGPASSRGRRRLLRVQVDGLSDLVIYGPASPDGDVSFIDVAGAHTGPSEEEMQTLVVAPEGVGLPTPITPPILVAPHFVGYRA